MNGESAVAMEDVTMRGDDQNVAPEHVSLSNFGKGTSANHWCPNKG